MISRLLPLPASPSQSFFLWGSRQIGKSWLLRTRYPDAIHRDLLQTDLYLTYLREPHRLRQELESAPAGSLVVLDEVQKLPVLLDEVHWLIENRRLAFALCGSSARKVRRGHANLLGGRAIRFELYGLVSAEVGADFDLVRAVNHGNLPPHYLSDTVRPLLKAYVGDYLQEEVAAEGLTRNLPAFAHFLAAAALSDAEVVSLAPIARECGVSAPTVREYFQILEDTLLGRFLPAYTRRPKRRVVASPKFYFSNPGVVNILAKRGWLEPGAELFGKALESWVHHELRAYLHYRDRDCELAYWRLDGGREVDFVTDDLALAIEVKATTRVDHHDFKGLRELAADQNVGRRLLVCLERFQRRLPDGVEIWPVHEFLQALWADELL